MLEKRICMPRFKARLPVRFGKEGEQKDRLGFTDNVSPVGMFVITSRPEDPGSHLTVEVDLPGGKGTISISGQVAWSRSVQVEIRSVERPGFGIQLGVAPEAWYHYLAKFMV